MRRSLDTTWDDLPPGYVLSRNNSTYIKLRGAYFNHVSSSGRLEKSRPGMNGKTRVGKWPYESFIPVEFVT